MTTMRGGDPREAEFFVGYLPQQPPATARRVRRAVGLVAAVAVVAAVLLVEAQRSPAPAVFEYGTVRDFQGWIEEGAAPLLWLARPGAVGAAVAVLEPASASESLEPAAPVAAPASASTPRSAYLLVAPGKHGAGPLVAGFDGREVRLRGTLIYRGGDTMLEVEPGSVTPAAAGLTAPAPPAALPLGPVTLEGRIVDSKCYLGVMIPGEGKPHRDCAVRCIAGGVPPLLVVDDPAGGVRTVLLTGPGGRAINAQVLDVVAEPIQVTGDLKRLGGKLVLEADPAAIKRLR